MFNEETETATVTPLENSKVSLRSVYAIIICTVIILGYLTSIKSGVSDVGHSVDMVRQASDNDRQIYNLKLDAMQKQMDGNSKDIKQTQDDIEKLKLNTK